MPQDLHSQGPYCGAGTKNSGLPQGNPVNFTKPKPAHPENLGNDMQNRHIYINKLLPYRDSRYEQDRTGHQQTRFDKRC